MAGGNQALKLKPLKRQPLADYSAFERLDGSHPFKEAVPLGYVEYAVRELQQGQVSYFNYALAKEMGLINENHQHRMNKNLENKILETFSLRIINEYDEANKIQYPPSMIKQSRYMATRYLQLQHPNKTGKTSGDGRCIWNGFIEHNGTIWDVSSRGTGVTRLAPGFVEAGRPLRSGNTTAGYGCGMAEIDELYGAALMAEIFHANGLRTERVLCIIDLGRGIGIGVRAAPNLMRPAHFLLHLKQNNREALKRSIDYFIDRQIQNKEWKPFRSTQQRYDLFLDLMCETFANFSAVLDREYIFAWLDWDGDNVLANGGIIDYGSVRQFGLRHDQYRYDDVDRFSTTLNEQRHKTRTLVQAFAQAVDFLKTGQRLPLHRYRRHAILRRFDQLFEESLLNRFLYQLGFKDADRLLLKTKHHTSVQKLFETYRYLEGLKTYRGSHRVADGVNRPAIFNMRGLNRMLPQLLTEQNFEAAAHVLPMRLFAQTASRTDRKKGFERKIQNRFLRLLRQSHHVCGKLVTADRSLTQILGEMQIRADVINRPERITGNALIHIVDEILKHRKKGLSDHQIQNIMESVIRDQCLVPEFKKTPGRAWPERSERLMKTLLTVVDGFKEDI
jgi:uncharacterized protein YdiU (UPF0061 family)